MGRIVRASTLNAPVEAVWNALNDIGRTPEWVTGLEAAQVITPGDYGAGSAYLDVNRIGPFRQHTTWHVTVFVPQSRQLHVSTSAILPTTMTLSLRPAAGGTRVEQTVEYQLLPRLGLFGRLLERAFMNRMIGQVLEQNQASLGRHLGAGASSQPPARTVSAA